MASKVRANLRGLACLAVVLSGCTVDESSPPPLSGPSELGLSITLLANPDVITQDGFSQSVIVIEARDANAEPVRSLAVRAEIIVNGVAVDFGTLSARTLVTGTDGRARVTYTSPARPPEPVDQFTIVTVLVTPIGTNFANAVPRQVQIRLAPPGVIIPPNGTPVASFQFSPLFIEEGMVVEFDGSASSDDGGIVSYDWDFGDGGTGSGVRASHVYDLRGTYNVTLTVTDNRGLRDSTTQVVSVSATGNPIASFTLSPASPAIDERVFFNASASQAASGRVIVDYRWTFGDGGTGSGNTTSHTYSAAGNYTVVLTVEDDLGKTGTTSNVLIVGAPPTPTADFVFSPTTPGVDEFVTFDAAPSTASPGRRLVSYEWNFGDGGRSTGIRADHRYRSAGTFAVVLTVTDDAGVKATTSQDVTVGTPAGPTAAFSVSPNPLTLAGGTVFVDARASTAAPGATIVSYTWNFGDGPPAPPVSSATSSHTYGGVSADTTYTITLTVTDSFGGKDTVTRTVDLKAPTAPRGVR